MELLLSMTNIEKSFGPVQVLKKIDFEVEKGEVHALIGANGAGKSTLMKILCGELDYDDGNIMFDGKSLLHPSDKKMRSLGVAMIHQELCTIGDLTVAEYLFVGREPTKGLVINSRQMKEDALKLLENISADFSADSYMSNLSVAQQQMVEICKALSYNVKLLILDEPTTALGEQETQKVYEIIRHLKNQGVSIIYISHRLEELFAVSDRITVMRDGINVKTQPTAETEKSELVRLLAGRELKSGKKASSTVDKNAPTVLEVKNICTADLLDNVSFSLKKGEVLGLAGLMGCGRTETAKAICGIDPITSGEIIINGKKVNIRSPKEAAEYGICYLSEDRNGEGIIPGRSIIANTVISSLDRYRKFLSLNDEKMLSDSVEYIEKVKTKYFDPHAPLSSLSGGNAQKVIIARWLLRDCQILIFDEPTKGIDVGAKDEIYGIIAEIAKNGHSVIMISSETDELLNNCDRLIVLSDGRVSGELNIEDATSKTIMHYATEVK